MSNYFHDTEMNKCDATCGNCRYALECDEEGRVECDEHNYATSRTIAYIVLKRFLRFLYWLFRPEQLLELRIYKLKTQYCSEHEFREDC
jgi:hypothetical protein